MGFHRTGSCKSSQHQRGGHAAALRNESFIMVPRAQKHAVVRRCLALFSKLFFVSEDHTAGRWEVFCLVGVPAVYDFSKALLRGKGFSVVHGCSGRLMTSPRLTRRQPTRKRSMHRLFHSYLKMFWLLKIQTDTCDGFRWVHIIFT